MDIAVVHAKLKTKLSFFQKASMHKDFSAYCFVGAELWNISELE
jgi:hypothetical protein